jgi:hypothetical protein
LELNVVSQIAIFFSKMAMVNFGGANAVLAYVAQHAVEQYQWLKAGEMLDGLGMAKPRGDRASWCCNSSALHWRQPERSFGSDWNDSDTRGMLWGGVSPASSGCDLNNLCG